MWSSLITLLPLLATASAFPSLHARNNTIPPGSTVNPSLRQCVIPPGGSNTTDDSPAIIAAFRNCSGGGQVVFQKGANYYARTPITASNLTNVDVLFNGNLHLPQDIAYIQGIVNQSSATYLASVWISVAGSNVNWYGTNNATSGWIFGYGQQWWDLNGFNNSKATGSPNRPHLASFNVTNSNIYSWKVKKPIAWNMQISGNNVTIRDTVIDAFTSGGFPFNTDGFDVSGTNILIDGFNIQNGDDAVAIQSGARNVVVRNGFVGHHSHGLSVGSLGQNQALYANVSNITFDNIDVNGAVYAARFKSWIGGQGMASNITWSNFRVSNVTYPIFVTQTYFNQGSSQTQLQSGAVTGRPNNSSVVMENFTWANFTGDINYYDPGDRSCVSSPCWYDSGLDNLTRTDSIIFECNTNTSCTNFVTSNIQVFPQPILDPTVVCINVDGSRNPGLGFSCPGGNFNGTFVAY